MTSPARLGANSKIALGIGTGYGNTSGGQHVLPVPLLIVVLLFELLFLQRKGYPFTCELKINTLGSRDKLEYDPI